MKLVFRRKKIHAVFSVFKRDQSVENPLVKVIYVVKVPPRFCKERSEWLELLIAHVLVFYVFEDQDYSSWYFYKLIPFFCFVVSSMLPCYFVVLSRRLFSKCCYTLFFFYFRFCFLFVVLFIIFDATTDKNPVRNRPVSDEDNDDGIGRSHSILLET